MFKSVSVILVASHKTVYESLLIVKYWKKVLGYLNANSQVNKGIFFN